MQGVLNATGSHGRMININQRKIVNMITNCDYAALTYVWGSVEQLQLSSATEKRLKRKGGLSGESQDLPQVI